MISIITPNLNNAKYLEDNILSISKLSIPFEHIVVDGGSTDESLELVAKYPHIKLVKQTEKTGMYGAIDLGIKDAVGEIVTWVNADDRIISSGYEKMYKTITSSGVDFVYSDGYYHYTNDNYKKKGKGRRFAKFFLKHGLMPAIQPACLYTIYIYKSVGGLNFNKFKIVGDLDLFLKIAQTKGSRFKYISTLSVIFMKRGDSLGDMNMKLYLKEIKENRLPTPSLVVRAIFFLFKYI